MLAGSDKHSIFCCFLLIKEEYLRFRKNVLSGPLKNNFGFSNLKSIWKPWFNLLFCIGQ
jgi:hypothetical protein